MTTRTVRGETASISDDAERVEAIVRALAASINVRLIGLLAAERRSTGDDAWVHLSQAAVDLDEAPGTIAAAVGRLMLAGLVDEKRAKGKRYFRARVTDVSVTLSR